MQGNYSEYRTSFSTGREAYLSDEITSESRSIYNELDAISEEIEKCRSRNS